MTPSRLQEPDPDSTRLAKRLRRPAGHVDLPELASASETEEAAVRRPEESRCVFRAGQMPGLERLQVANPYAPLRPAGSERELAPIGRKRHPQAVILVFGQQDLEARRFHGSRRLGPQRPGRRRRDHGQCGRHALPQPLPSCRRQRRRGRGRFGRDPLQRGFQIPRAIASDSPDLFRDTASTRDRAPREQDRKPTAPGAPESPQ